MKVTDEMLTAFVNAYFGRGRTYNPEAITTALQAAIDVMPKREPLSEEDINNLVYWVHKLYAEIPDKRENFPLFDEVNASGVLLIDLTKITE
jgi:hypothetical protein